jgi:hypothetical protein
MYLSAPTPGEKKERGDERERDRERERERKRKRKRRVNVWRLGAGGEGRG